PPPPPPAGLLVEAGHVVGARHHVLQDDTKRGCWRRRPRDDTCLSAARRTPRPMSTSGGARDPVEAGSWREGGRSQQDPRRRRTPAPSSRTGGAPRPPAWAGGGWVSGAGRGGGGA